MTARATLTQAQIARAIRAATACGKVAVMTPQGIVFAESGSVALPSPESVEPAPLDVWIAKREARRERLA
jgi:hypothetical protein